MNSAEIAATSLLKNLWTDKGKSLPVDPAVLASELGINVVEGQLPTDVSGALIKKEGEDPVVLLNQNDSVTRKRFTCAHEIGHYIERIFFSSADHRNAYEYVDFRTATVQEKKSESELFADDFAAELLMPRGEVNAVLSAITDDIQQIESNDNVSMAKVLPVAERFGVSNSAAIYRIKYLDK